MNLLVYLLAKKTFWESVKYELEDIAEMIKEFFLMIKEVTYDVLAGFVGENVVNMFLIGIGALVIMLICLKIINR